ncbi:MAG: DegT/DnrJ/EryC1/StrS family aminotransferase [Promethearchaeati archaeon SRVP18_Atabeyarchaeia-1]
MIPINRPIFGPEEKEEVAKVLESGIVTNRLGEGPMNKAFQKELADYLGVRHVLTVSSGTAALHSSLLAAGVGYGDEVIVPPFTFVATANVALLAGARPVFADINSRTYTIDPQKLKRAITKRTKAVIPVHLYGHPVDMDPIMEIAEEKGIAVVEDCAQSIGSQYRGKATGSIGQIGCFSFYASKNMTTGEGGAVATNDDELAERIWKIRRHGEKEEYQCEMLGHNYRMPEIEAAIGRVQLRKLPSFLEARATNAAALTKGLTEKTEALDPPIVEEWAKHSWYLYTTRVTNDRSPVSRNDLMRKLAENGITAAAYYESPIHLSPYYARTFKYRKGDFPESEKAADEVLSLPCHPAVTQDEISKIVDTLSSLLK